MTRRLVLGTFASLAAALAGGVVWGLIVKWTEYRIPAVAWVIGVIAAFAALLTAGRCRGISLQVTAVATTLVGVLVGKYLGYAWEAEEIGDRFGFEVVEIHSATMMRAFRDNLDYAFGWLDLLWVGLAVVTAAYLTRAPRSGSDRSGEPSAE